MIITFRSWLNRIDWLSTTQGEKCNDRCVLMFVLIGVEVQGEHVTTVVVLMFVPQTALSYRS